MVYMWYIRNVALLEKCVCLIDISFWYCLRIVNVSAHIRSCVHGMVSVGKYIYKCLSISRAIVVKYLKYQIAQKSFGNGFPDGTQPFDKIDVSGWRQWDTTIKWEMGEGGVGVLLLIFIAIKLNYAEAFINIVWLCIYYVACVCVCAWSCALWIEHISIIYTCIRVICIYFRVKFSPKNWNCACTSFRVLLPLFSYKL